MTDNYLEFAKDLALRAGEIMLEHFAVGVAFTSKADSSPLTIADTAINTLVIEEVAKHFPDHAVRGEEESNQQDHHTMVWVCDPIDGTIPYMYGIPTNVFSLALVKNGEPIMGVVYDPYLKRLYSAEKGKGAFLNEQRIQVNTKALNPHEPVGLSCGSKVVDVSRFYGVLHDKGLRMFDPHSCIYTAMLVASGQLLAHTHSGTHPHDVATSKIIVEEAGGKVTDLHGQEQRYDQPIYGALISNGVTHEDLIALIKPHLI